MANPYNLQRQALADVVDLAHQDVRGLWPQLQSLPLADARNDLADILYSAGTQYGDAAAALAADHYDEIRAMQSEKGQLALPGFDPVLAEEVTPERYKALSNWGTENLVHDRSAAQWAVAQEKTFGGLQRTIADQHRGTITRSALADPSAQGWTRIGVGDSCKFCAMLIGRTTRTKFWYEKGGGVYTQQTVVFPSHDHCNCSAAPNFSDIIAPPRIFDTGLGGKSVNQVAAKGIPLGREDVYTPAVPNNIFVNRGPSRTARDIESNYIDILRTRPGGLDGAPGEGALQYGEDWYGPMNKHLRDGHPIPPSGGSNTEVYLRSLETEFETNASVLPANQTIYRGVRPHDDLIGLREGDYFVDAGYSSATTDWNVAEVFANNDEGEARQIDEGWIYEIEAKEGQRVVQPVEEADRYGEQELILPRNQKYRVLKIDKLTHTILMELI